MLSDARVPDSTVAKVRDRLLTGQRCIIRLDVRNVVAACRVWNLGSESESAMTPDEVRRGPTAMSTTELFEFLGDPPTGALCVERNGQLLALPAQLLRASNGIWEIATDDGCDVILPDSAPACLVADSFVTYQGIQGVIVQAQRNPSDGDASVVVVRPLRLRSFSFSRSSN